MKRDIFRSFFSTEEDDLDQQPRFESPRNIIAKNEDKSGETDRNDDPENGAIDMGSTENPSQLQLIPENIENIEEENRDQPRSSGFRPPVDMSAMSFDFNISLPEALRLLSKTRIRIKNRIFTVLSPLGKNQFRKREADALDKASMVAALELPSDSRFIARDNSKRLKLTAPTAILDAARSQQLQAVLKVKQPNVQELIRRFDDCDEIE